MVSLPDLALAYYVRKTREWFQSNDVLFLLLEHNRPHVSQARLIEMFRALGQ